MSRYSYGYPKYVSVAEKRAKAERKILQLKKKNPAISPVCVKGNKLAESWWGISWNKNLESYADYSNRIGRGRSYVRHGAVLDLKIKSGKIISLVQGSFSKPYTIEISIQKIKTAAWENILQKCQGQIDSMNSLLDGKLPKSMMNILVDKKDGIFPSPGEIKFYCSCPDSATMCKHIAATLYGVGTRLDQNPSLFFTLRGVDMKKLVSQAIRKKADQLIQKSKTKTSKRIIQNADLSSTFGIDFDPSPLPETTKPLVPAQKKSTQKPIIKAITKASKQDVSPYETVVRIISRRKVTPIDFKEIKKRTGLEDTLIRNIIARAKQKGAIKNKGRGLYIKNTNGVLAKK
ncbi:MAG: hypothetical protein DRH26_06325 [Deltaproteobacteria bacterium]|nr:MAG: hypothetical protein DRH26_06325 [Deltaproteobacteria bacterium]